MRRLASSIASSYVEFNDRCSLPQLFAISELLAKSLNYDSPPDSDNCGFTTRSNNNSPINLENCWFTMSDAILFSKFLVAHGGVIGGVRRNLPIDMLINKT